MIQHSESINNEFEEEIKGKELEFAKMLSEVAAEDKGEEQKAETEAIVAKYES